MNLKNMQKHTHVIKGKKLNIQNLYIYYIWRLPIIQRVYEQRYVDDNNNELLDNLVHFMSQ